MKVVLRIFDYLIISFKLFMLFVLIMDFNVAQSGFYKNVAFQYLLPFIFYGLIGIVRIFKYKNLQLLYIEILLNIYFTITVNKQHAYFLILTAISLAITLYLFYEVKILKR
jgi:hypothetical protein